MRRSAWLRMGLWVWLSLPVLALTGCDALFPAAEKPKPPAISPQAQAAQYMTDLAVVRLLLDPGRNEIENAKPFLRSLNAFKKQAHRKSSVELTVLVIEYTVEKQKGKYKLLVPLSQGKEKFDHLQEVLKRLSGSPYVMHNLQVFHMPFTAPPKEAFSAADAETLRQQLAAEQQQWMVKTQNLSLQENAEMKLALVRFFMQLRLRDAAYLALENAKGVLAQMAVKQPQQKEPLQRLSKEAEILENNLHRDMPYRF